MDFSGRGNNGAVSGATWADGRFGKALSFDGVNDVVTVSDSDSLDLAGGMTLEAWVNARSVTGWRTVLLKERPGQLRASVEISTAANSFEVRAPAPQLPLNAWTHVAATFDGATLRLYRNGTQVATRAVSGTILTSSNPLRIGGNGIWGEYFNGRIDEIRIYNRVLGQPEIQADMNSAVGASP